MHIPSHMPILTFRGNFLFDDVVAIQNNPDVNPDNDWTRLRALEGIQAQVSFRDLVTSLSVSCELKASRTFHLLNLLLHALNSALLLSLLRQTLGEPFECPLGALRARAGQEEENASLAASLLFGRLMKHEKPP
eukprot:766985-Hanusia_phi.AAC.1